MLVKRSGLCSVSRDERSCAVGARASVILLLVGKMKRELATVADCPPPVQSRRTRNRKYNHNPMYQNAVPNMSCVAVLFLSPGRVAQGHTGHTLPAATGHSCRCVSRERNPHSLHRHEDDRAGDELREEVGVHRVLVNHVAAEDDLSRHASCE